MQQLTKNQNYIKESKTVFCVSLCPIM